METQSPRFQAILRVTSGRKKKFPADIKSFSHELNPKGACQFPFRRPRGLSQIEEILGVLRAKSDRVKEEVDADLAIFAGDLVGILEKNAEAHPEWRETLEDMLVLARQCALMSPGEFWLKCEGIVQKLDDRRQELPMGTLKKLNTRILFILTRCTRLLQFQREGGLVNDMYAIGGLHQFSDLGLYGGVIRDFKSLTSQKEMKEKLKQNLVNRNSSDGGPTKIFSSPSRNRISSWKKLPSAAEKNQKKGHDDNDYTSEEKLDSLQLPDKVEMDSEVDSQNLNSMEFSSESLPNASDPSTHQKKVSWGHWGDQQNVGDENSMICRICELEIPTLHVEDHSVICTMADRCDLKGLTVDERLERIADILERILESCTPKSSQAAGAGSPEVTRVSNTSANEGLDGDGLSPKHDCLSRRCSEDMLDCIPEADTSITMDDLKDMPTISCKTRFGPAFDPGQAASFAGSMTPRSPLLTPRVCPIDLLLTGKSAISESENLSQIHDLIDISRYIASIEKNNDRALEYLITCLEDLQDIVQCRKVDALIVETLGRRIEKLLREKYLHLCELIEDEKTDSSSNMVDEDGGSEDDVVRSLRTSPKHLNCKDRTSIEDFEIIKPISRGAFGRVFLARKRITGDLFAIKVLKKADMIRKNAVESILAERNILISVRNPFVVRFFYSFTCRENLYLVMEYLNGGDLYSLLRNLGCLDEDMARVYIAEVVLALEYLHSLHVVHRDLKPDNLLIAHDGHIKLTDFGLSKVGLINSTDDLSGPAVSGTALLEEDNKKLSASEKTQKREQRQKRSAVGTPDYLAPEILLGMGHGTTADWWSVGVILFEVIVGIPPFNAEHPQLVFDNIMNRNIQWPQIPDEMSFEAQDLIDKLLIEDPVQRLGATGAGEVKRHVFFKDINWDTLARQKAAFVPAAEGGALDTSYFTCRYNWHPSDHVRAVTNDFDNLTDTCSNSSNSSNLPDEEGDECCQLADFGGTTLSVKYSFSNFSFKNLSQLAAINYDLTKGAKDPAETSNASIP